ncbi:MAG TPA: NADPH-dependent assimilatory sulfite reductase hemoprotein subunit [Verrucomicrobiota bacterium]|nr:NADPH-dependent assimilatory sulfite reductase hemoprotein subunit [Verrucomicrobiota bacterium]
MTTTAGTPKLTHNEEIKAAIPTLAGTIAATIADESADHFSDDDNQFLKFHGSYQQDDRDLRKTGKKYIMMIRGRIPGGVMTARQWCVFDDLAAQYGNNTLRITTRQSIQFHGVVKSGLRPLVKKINESLLSTLAACGDVNRNVLAPPTPAYTKARGQVYADAHKVAMALAPQTKAYHSIWIDGVQLDNEAAENKNFVDPLYGKTYLPRKFKTAFVIPPVNDLDVFTNCLGFIAIVENDKLVGYNLCVGGGMGRSHGNEATYPRLADVIGFFTPDKIVEVSKSVLTIHRDFGDRTDRKHARLKYVVAERGVDFIRDEVNKRAGITLQPAKPYRFTTMGDIYGWHKAVDGSWFIGLFVSMGRVKDAQKIALREVAEKHPGIEFRLSANQNVILANVSDADKAGIDAILSRHGVKTENQTTVMHAASMACPALPTCGLALAESERMLPGLVDRIEKLCGDLGLGNEEIIIRSTGCPNGCARPYMAEIAFVGKAPGRYQVWLGGNAAGTRLNRIWKDMVKDPEMETELRPVFARFAKERHAGERFGDWCDRVLLKEPATTN